MASVVPNLDVERFWGENRLCAGKPFRVDKPRAPIAVPVDDHWLLQEMKVPSTVKYFREPEYQADVNRRCNDRCEEMIGVRPFGEAPPLPGPIRIEEVMGSRREVVEGGTPWLEAGVASIEDLRLRLDQVERWSDAEFREIVFLRCGQREPKPAGGPRSVARAGSRGPATQATSILGTMKAMYWLIDYPADMGRFFEVLGDVIIRYHRLMEAVSGIEYRGYYWLDDNCALYSPDLYTRFCYPVMKRVTDTFAPAAGDYRFQHSDSAMAHLLPQLATLNLHGVNFGPTLPASLIREHLPNAEIHGQIAPNTLRDKGLDEVVSEVKRDFTAVGGDGGLLVTTCGSISAGTSLESIRGFMWAVQEFCRYDGKS